MDAKLKEILIGSSKAIDSIRKLIVKIAAADNASVLLLGPSGTGKTLIASLIHDLSHRKSYPFVPVNCGAIPKELLESELFGHEKGAFTGALHRREGRFELANQGTLFLDEIGDMPLPMQVKLLRVLQEKTFERIGSNLTLHVDVRIIAATHQNLEKAIENKTFREDLFYRLCVLPLEIPALKQRREDIPLLIKHVLEKISLRLKRNLHFSSSAIETLTYYDWPGNIRELFNFIERTAVLHDKECVELADLPEKYLVKHKASDLLKMDSFSSKDYEADNNECKSIECLSTSSLYEDFCNKLSLAELQFENSSIANNKELSEKIANSDRFSKNSIHLKDALQEIEKNLILQALKRHDYVTSHAAHYLNIGRTTLIDKIKKYGLQNLIKELKLEVS